MAEIGEEFSPPQFLQDAAHSEDTCPWHKKDPPPQAVEMDPAADNEDSGGGNALGPMAANNGGKLGANMGGKDDTKIMVKYPSKPAPVEQELQWAPHHLIPGNASLKNSSVVKYLGDDAVIAKFGSGSKIKKGQSVGYNVNDAANGAWLVSPYALSMKGKWPTDPAAKLAYVEAAIDQPGGGGGNVQFHMSHGQYSTRVRSIVDELGAKLKLITQKNVCPLANEEEADKFNAPMGLKSRLNGISAQMRRIVSGPVWQGPYTDDSLMPAYIAKKNMKKAAGLLAEFEKISIGSGG